MCDVCDSLNTHHTHREPRNHSARLNLFNRIKLPEGTPKIASDSEAYRKLTPFEASKMEALLRPANNTFDQLLLGRSTSMPSTWPTATRHTVRRSQGCAHRCTWRNDQWLQHRCSAPTNGDQAHSSWLKDPDIEAWRMPRDVMIKNFRQRPASMLSTGQWRPGTQQLAKGSEHQSLVIARDAMIKSIQHRCSARGRHARHCSCSWLKDPDIEAWRMPHAPRVKTFRHLSMVTRPQRKDHTTCSRQGGEGWGVLLPFFWVGIWVST